MKKYDQFFQLPLITVNGVLIPKLILGHLPFMGESYQGIEKNQEYCKRFSNVENTIHLLKKAVESYGITVIANTASTEGGLATLFLKAITETIKATSTEIALIPCFMIPLRLGDKPIDDYRRWITYYEYEKKTSGEKILRQYIEDPIL